MGSLLRWTAWPIVLEAWSAISREKIAITAVELSAIALDLYVYTQ